MLESLMTKFHVFGKAEYYLFFCRRELFFWTMMPVPTGRRKKRRREEDFFMDTPFPSKGFVCRFLVQNSLTRCNVEFLFNPIIHFMTSVSDRYLKFSIFKSSPSLWGLGCIESFLGKIL